MMGSLLSFYLQTIHLPSQPSAINNATYSGKSPELVAHLHTQFLPDFIFSSNFNKVAWVSFTWNMFRTSVWARSEAYLQTARHQETTQPRVGSYGEIYHLILH